MRIEISDDAAALACGADEVAAAFARAAPEAEIVRRSSWGMHWLEPLVVIDGLGHGPVAVGDVEAILAGDQRLAIGAPGEHPFIACQQRLTFARAGKTRALSLEDYAAAGGWAALARAREMGGEAVIAELTTSGLRGRGGAGFPAGIKWKTVAQTSADQKYIVCNADEGDSGTFADRMVMEGDPFALIEGMAIAGFAVGASHGFIYVRSEYPHAIAKLNAAIEASRAKVAPFTLEVRVGAGAYICGEETSLLNSLEGRRGEVRAKPPLPAHEGAFGKPTVVNNVLTLAAVPHILVAGGDHYKGHGFERSLGTMPIQLAGNIRHGGLFEIAFGMSLGELIEDVGGGTASGRPVRAVQIGGPLGAYFPPSMFHLPYDYEAFTTGGGLLGHGGIVVFDDTVDMLAQARFSMAFTAAESCGKCTPCRIGAVRGVELLDRIAARQGRARDAVERLPQMHNAPSRPRTLEDEVKLLRDLCETMELGSLCALGGFAPFPVLSALNHWPEDFGLPRQEQPIAAE